MKSICYDVHHAIARRWFLAALIATTVALYLSVGQATYGLIGYLESYELFEENSFGYSMTDMLTMGMKGAFGLLTLPALSALPLRPRRCMRSKAEPSVRQCFGREERTGSSVRSRDASSAECCCKVRRWGCCF